MLHLIVFERFLEQMFPYVDRWVHEADRNYLIVQSQVEKVFPYSRFDRILVDKALLPTTFNLINKILARNSDDKFLILAAPLLPAYAASCICSRLELPVTVEACKDSSLVAFECNLKKLPLKARSLLDLIGTMGINSPSFGKLVTEFMQEVTKV